jgi:hypothetical protein
MKRTAREKKLINLVTKKTIHVNLTTASHAALKIACFNHAISMQEAIEEFAHLIAVGHPDTIAILESVNRKKLKDQIKQLDNFDEKTIYDILELESPLKDSV